MYGVHSNTNRFEYKPLNVRKIFNLDHPLYSHFMLGHRNYTALSRRASKGLSRIQFQINNNLFNFFDL